MNYPERALGKRYAKMYWGKSLQRLKRVKRAYDPEGFFANRSPFPDRKCSAVVYVALDYG